MILRAVPISKTPRNAANRFFKIRRAFWPFSKKNDEEKQKLEEEKNKKLSDFNNLGFLITKVKEENVDYGKNYLEEKPKSEDNLLPNGKEKLTVCIEMDDTFLNVFYPDELEGYLNMPLKDYDYYIDFGEYNTFLNIYMRQDYKILFEYLKENTEAVIYSTGTKPYVDAVMDLIDPNYEIFKYRLHQEHCNFVEYPDEEIAEFVKDLDILGRDLRRTVLIDTKPFSYWCNPDNSIPLKPYNGNILEDNEMNIIKEILENLENSEDVRFDLAESYGLRDTLKEANLI